MNFLRPQNPLIFGKVKCALKTPTAVNNLIRQCKTTKKRRFIFVQLLPFSPLRHLGERPFIVTDSPSTLPPLPLYKSAPPAWAAGPLAIDKSTLQTPHIYTVAHKESVACAYLAIHHPLHSSLPFYEPDDQNDTSLDLRLGYMYITYRSIT